MKRTREVTDCAGGGGEEKTYLRSRIVRQSLAEMRKHTDHVRDDLLAKVKEEEEQQTLVPRGELRDKELMEKKRLELEEKGRMAQEKLVAAEWTWVLAMEEFLELVLLNR